MSTKKVAAYCLDWHVKQSDAFIDMLVEPLKSYLNIKLTAWDGEVIPKNSLNDNLAIFCMLPPAEDFLNSYKGKVVWLPMWDQAQGYDQAWWNNLPKTLCVVAFSDRVRNKSMNAGLPTLGIKYFKDPDVFNKTSWEDGRVVFYWNRTGLVGPEFLKDLCDSVQAKELIFLGDIDPRISDDKKYSMPSKIGNTKVTQLKHTDRDAYLKAVGKSNIFIAPRSSEGVGMTFLEAMAKGCCVIAYDAPTMNEYINDGKNGILLRNKSLSFADKLFSNKPADEPSGETFYLRSQQNWSKISRINFQALGNKARDDHISGYKIWDGQIAEYAKFVMDKI